jgi:hypothetical protein
VHLKKDKPLNFPDFTITFTGERYQGTKFIMLFYEFKIKYQNEEKTISWSSGTGDLGPSRFTVNSKKFDLELKYFEKNKKWLKQDELVISQVR